MEEKGKTGYRSSGIFVIMDDEEVLRDILNTILTSMGFTVVCKENGKDTIKYVTDVLQKGEKIRGMLFDLTISRGMGGKETIAEIRKINSEIPAFVISGYSDDPVISDPQKYGFTASISKPFTWKGIEKMLERYLK
jgi:DNA-binding NtrC family response regulator